MTAEPAVPVARLEKLWRRLRRHALRLRREARENAIYEHGQASGYMAAAADIRAVIDEVKKGETR